MTSGQGKLLNELKWSTRQRLQFIEIMAFYAGSIARSDVARAFGISDAAATKDIKLYNDLAPDNLSYRQNVFGFIPTEKFEPLIADLSPQHALPVIAANLAATGGPYGDEPIFGIRTQHLPIPNRFPERSVLANIIQAIRHNKKLAVAYHSLSQRESRQLRVIEPHALIDTGLRWHVRAYNTETYDFRDFVLSRFEEATVLDEAAESSAQFDDDWCESISIILKPHPGLAKEKQDILLMDYGSTMGVIEISVRRALIGYLLNRLNVDTTADHSLNPKAYQLALANREEIEPFAAWVLQD